MTSLNKTSETGSNPYYLNLNDTAKDFSTREDTNPEFGLLEAMTKSIIIEDNLEIMKPYIENQMIINKDRP